MILEHVFDGCQHHIGRIQAETELSVGSVDPRVRLGWVGSMKIDPRTTLSRDCLN